MSNRMKALVAAVIVASGIAACARLDGLVYRALPVTDLNADLMEGSVVPKELREELKTEIVAKDGTKVSGYLVKHSNTDGTPTNRHDTAILYCHGNNTNIGTTVPRIDALWKLGYTVLAIDYRGFGKTQGTPTDVGIYQDAEAGRKYLETHFTADKVGIYGRSLGTAICSKVAADAQTKALALESPISSIQRIIDDSTSLDTPSGYYTDSTLDNFAQVKRFNGALFILHGLADTYVRPDYGKELSALAEGKANPNQLWLVPNADHGTVPCTEFEPAEKNDDCKGGFSEEYFDRVSKFYDAALGIPK